MMKLFLIIEFSKALSSPWFSLFTIYYTIDEKNLVRIVTQIELRKTVKTSHLSSSYLLSKSMADCRAIVDVLATMASDENMISIKKLVQPTIHFLPSIIFSTTWPWSSS